MSEKVSEQQGKTGGRDHRVNTPPDETPRKKDKETVIREQRGRVCRYCKLGVEEGACVCPHCNRHQNPFWEHIQHIGILVSLVMMVIAFFKLREASRERVAASFSLDLAQRALADAKDALGRGERAIQQLQDLAKTSGAITLQLVKTSDRWSGFSYEEQENAREAITELMRTVGIPVGDVNTLVESTGWYRWTEWDYVCYILGGPSIPDALPQGRIKEWEELRGRGLAQVARPEEVRRFLESCGILTAEGEELILDYEYYIRHHEQRRPDVWKNREEWKHLRRTK